MKLNDLILVSVDDHVIEPPNAFAFISHRPCAPKNAQPCSYRKVKDHDLHPR